MSEIAIALVLLIAAGMLGRTLLRLSSLDPGIKIHNVLITRVALSSDALSSPAHMRVVWQEILDRVRQVPGVHSVAVADIIPMGGETDEIGYARTTPAAPPVNQMPMSLLNVVTPGYLRVMGIPLRQGRFFTEQDRIGNEPVIAIDEVLAKRTFGGRDAVGNRLWVQFLGPARVVGVVGHVRHQGLDADDQAKVREQIYLPFAQLPDPFLRLTSSAESLVIRTTISPLSIVDAVRRQVRGATRDQAIYDVRTMEQLVGGTLARQRFLLLLFGIFAGLALLLACIGLYGVLAYLTSRRVPEIGLRMALGATVGDVMRLVLRQSLGMILVGAGTGSVAKLAAGKLLERFVAGVKPRGTVDLYHYDFGLFVGCRLVRELRTGAPCQSAGPVEGSATGVIEGRREMTWWQRLWHRGQMEDQLEKELRFHLEQHTADLIARGQQSGGSSTRS